MGRGFHPSPWAALGPPHRPATTYKEENTVDGWIRDCGLWMECSRRFEKRGKFKYSNLGGKITNRDFGQDYVSFRVSLSNLPRTANMAQPKKTNDFKQLDWTAPSREWDIRVNLGEDYQKELEHFMGNVRSYIESVNVVYFLVGEVEKGENQEHSSYEQYHVHAGLITKDRVYPRALKEKLGLNKFSDGTSRHYYLRMRKTEYTYQ